MSTLKIIEDYWEEVGVKTEHTGTTEEEKLLFLIDSHRRQREVVGKLSATMIVQNEYGRLKELDESMERLFKVGMYDPFVVGDLSLYNDEYYIIKDEQGGVKLWVDKDYKQFTHNNNTTIKSKEYIEYIKEALTYYLWKKEKELKVLTKQIIGIRTID